MTIDPRHSYHLPDEDLVALLYLGDLTGTHAATCDACQQRLQLLLANREQVERRQLPTLDITPHRLAEQRRSIYARVSQPVPLWSMAFRPRWISAAATALVLGGGLFVFQHRQATVSREDTISDVDLAQEVSQLSQSPEPMPAEPLKGLFE